MTDPITGPCPNCGDVATRTPYDIGSGPELACASCDWCWGAAGQDLQPLDVQAAIAEAHRGLDEMDRQSGLEPPVRADG